MSVYKYKNLELIQALSRLWKEECNYNQVWKHAWKSDSQIDILVTRQRWISIIWHLAAALASAQHERLISSSCVACPENPVVDVKQ